MQPASRIPDPRLVVLENLTPFEVFQCDKMAPGRRFFDVVVLKAELELTPGVLRFLGPGEIVFGDDHWDTTQPERTSLRRAGDVLLTKPSTDVVVTGTARAPRGAPSSQWEVAVVVRGASGSVLSHELRGTGPRRWEHRALRGWTLTDPQPTLEIPIRYELAWGGAYRERSSDEWVVHRPNPSGVGFFDPRALDTHQTYTAPQWELASDPVTAPNQPLSPAGLGPIARPWQSRLQYAGTYDAEWERKAREDAKRGIPPDYAADLDYRFFQCAHPGLIAPAYLHGDEQIGLRGLLGGSGDFLTRLPDFHVHARLSTAPGQWSDYKVPLDTVHIDLDASRAHLCWRLSLDQSRGVYAAVLRMERGPNG